jgi:hypothetical protein
MAKRTPDAGAPGPASLRRLRMVNVEDAPLELVWADPNSLTEHDLNWRSHPPYQTDVVSELIRKHGWIVPLVVNARSGKILDGHDRRKIAISKGIPAVPVIIGDWPIEQEPEILASLDPSAMLAQGDPEALHRLMQQLADPSPVIKQLIDSVAEGAGVLEMLEQQAAADPDPAPVVSAEPPAREQVSFMARGPFHRVVTLELGVEAYASFVEMIDALAEVYGIPKEPPTEVILAALREAATAHLDPAAAGAAPAR